MNLVPLVYFRNSGDIVSNSLLDKLSVVSPDYRILRVSLVGS